MASRKNTKEYTIPTLREYLRQHSTEQAELLARSVRRLTSYDSRPCTEYHCEITDEYAIIDMLLYIQQCRNTLERCIDSGAARLRYHWQDGRVTDTRFSRSTPGKIKVSGLVLLAEEAAPAAG